MADTLQSIQTLSQEQIKYAKKKYMQIQMENLDEEIKKEAARPQKLVIQNLRQFIPYSDETKNCRSKPLFAKKSVF